jgi:hypothetical protein
MVRIYIFGGRNGRYGFTPEQDGSNLPNDLGPWQPYQRLISIEVFREYPTNRKFVEERDIIISVDAQGYYITVPVCQISDHEDAASE